MQQRTYSRLPGGVRDSGSQKNEQTHISPFPSNITMEQSDLQPTFINAPTSLTNLAQLSGISLVPINERRTTLNLNSNNSQLISFNSHQQPKITVNPRSRPAHSATIHRTPVFTSNHIREQTTYNLNSIPSIQLLNRATTDHQRAQKATTITPRIDLKPQMAATTSHPQPSRLDTSNSNNRTFQAISRRQFVNISQISPSSVIPRTLDQQSSNNDPLQTTGSKSPPDDVDCNISLHRLMAIFNNPALTITPVGPTSTTAPHYIDSNSRASISAVSCDKVRWPLPHVSSDPHQPTSDRSQVAVLASTRESGHTFEGSKAVMVDMRDHGNHSTDHRLRPEDSKPSSNDNHTVTLSWSPIDMNNYKPLDLNQETNPIASINSARDPVEPMILQADNSSQMDQSEEKGQECVTIARKADLKPLEKIAMSKSNLHRLFSKNDRPKPTKAPIISTKRQLYIPRREKLITKKVKLELSFDEVEVDTIEQDSYVSERHSILSKIDEIAESPDLKRKMTVRPNDISIGPTKKVMSTIDVIMRDYEEQCQPEENDEATLIKYEFDSRRPFINEALVLPIQLPLDEELTENKREYLSFLGLVSRHEKNKIIAQQSEDRLLNFCSLDEFGDFSDQDGDVRRIVDTLIQAGGDDINLRTDTDIKRNELPFIEGLNRNTSRIKMTFMNALGLEKRSKRTTLYKVVKPQEVMSGNSMELKAQSDLINTVKNINFNHTTKTKYPPTNFSSQLALPTAKTNQSTTVNQVTGNGMNSIKASGGSAEILRRAIKLAQASCREVLHKAPNKDEYMKSLGLMAS